MRLAEGVVRVQQAPVLAVGLDQIAGQRFNQLLPLRSNPEGCGVAVLTRHFFRGTAALRHIHNVEFLRQPGHAKAFRAADSAGECIYLVLLRQGGGQLQRLRRVALGVDVLRLDFAPINAAAVIPLFDCQLGIEPKLCSLRREGAGEISQHPQFDRRRRR